MVPIDSKIGTLGAYMTDGINAVRRTVSIKRLVYALFRACLCVSMSLHTITSIT
jgi:hypothetical protein